MLVKTPPKLGAFDWADALKQGAKLYEDFTANKKTALKVVPVAAPVAELPAPVQAGLLPGVSNRDLAIYAGIGVLLFLVFGRK